MLVYILLAYNWCTISEVKIQLAIEIISAVLYNIPTFAQFRIGHSPSNNRTMYTGHIVSTKRWLARGYRLIYSTAPCAVCLSVLPSCVIAFLNIRLIKASKTRRLTQMQRHNLRTPTRNYMTIILLIICIVSIVCQMPSLQWRINNGAIGARVPGPELQGGPKFLTNNCLGHDRLQAVPWSE